MIRRLLITILVMEVTGVALGSGYLLGMWMSVPDWDWWLR